MPTLTSGPLARREFLVAGAAGLAVASLPSRIRAARAAPAAFPDRARNVIFMVSDGMSSGTLAIADHMSRRRDNRSTNWVELWRRPHVRRSSAFTASADSPVTDSGAGGSAWGCGRRVNNGSLNVTPDGNEHLPILLHAKKHGKAVGVVTTTRITHATPASFYANTPKRDLENVIAEQLVERRLDVALGGGRKHFKPDVLSGNAGVSVVRTKDQLGALVRAAADVGRPVLGVFTDDHMSFEFDRKPHEPTLTEMTDAALRLLSPRKEGFVLQVEGGRVDHAAHNNDAGSLVAEQLGFDAAIGVVLDFVKDRDDTLVILTSDHGNANPGMTFYGKGAETRFDRLRSIRHSFDWVFSQPRPKGPSPESGLRLKELVGEATGIVLRDSEVAMLQSSIAGKRVSPFAEANGAATVLGAILADSLGIGFMSPHHTADMVEVTALGPGSATLPPVIENVALWDLMVGAMALEPA